MSAKKIGDKVKEVLDNAKTSSLPGVPAWIPTGCTILDIAIANRFPGGIPVGRIFHIFGGTGTCKTMLAATALGYAKRIGMECYYGDVEHTLAADFVKDVCNLDCDELDGIGYPESIEDLFDNWLRSIIVPKKGKINDNPKMVVVDSVTALPAEIEQDKSMSDQGYGAYRARQMSLAFRKYIKLLADSNTTLFLIDQARTDINSLHGGETVTGGRASEYYASVRVYLKHDQKVVNSAKTPLGTWTKFQILKNNVAPPFREGRFRILFDYGIDDISSNLYFLSEFQNGPREAKKLLSTIELFGEKKSRKAWVSYIEENNLEEELRKEVWKVWQQKYSSEKRKPRVW